MRSIPNIAFESVPVGKDDSENIVLREREKSRILSLNRKIISI